MSNKTKNFINMLSTVSVIAQPYMHLLNHDGSFDYEPVQYKGIAIQGKKKNKSRSKRKKGR